MGVNSLPKTVTRQRRDCDLNPGPSAPESSTLTTRLLSHPHRHVYEYNSFFGLNRFLLSSMYVFLIASLYFFHMHVLLFILPFCTIATSTALTLLRVRF